MATGHAPGRHKIHMCTKGVPRQASAGRRRTPAVCLGMIAVQKGAVSLAVRRPLRVARAPKKTAGAGFELGWQQALLHVYSATPREGGGGQRSVSKQRGRLVCARAAVPLAHAAGCSSRGGGASGLSTPKAARATARRSVRAQSHVHGCCGVPQARRKKRFATPLPPKNSRARPRQHMCGAAACARARVRAGPVIHILESPGGCEAPRGGGAVGRASRITPCAPL